MASRPANEWPVLPSTVRPFEGPPAYQNPQDTAAYYDAWAAPPRTTPATSWADIGNNNDDDMELEQLARAIRPVPGGFHFDAQLIDPAEVAQRRVTQREKQIVKGKNTVGYARYTKAVPRRARRPDEYEHPVTPDARDNSSKRQWDGNYNAWRRRLHHWDPVPQRGADDETDNV